QLEGKISTLPQSAGSSIGGFLNSARYELGRGLTFAAQDGGASMTVGGQVQVGYSWAEDDNGTTGSDFNSAARIRVGGSAMDGKVSYFVQMSPTDADAGQGDDNLIDAWAGWQLQDNLNLRLGQQKMRSGLSADTSANDTDFETSTRSIATNEFANRRATGALLEGHSMEGRLNYHAGVMNRGTADFAESTAAGAGLSAAGQANDDTDMAWTAGVSYGSHAGNSESWSEGDLARSGDMQWITGATITADNGPDNLTTVNVFGGLKMGNGVAAQVEWWTRDADDADTSDNGGYAQISYTMAKAGSMQPGFVFRWGTIDHEAAAAALGVSDIEQTELVLGANAYYAEHNLKTQVQIRNVNTDVAGADGDNTSIDLLFTLVF
ncbi:MAG: porin, partial [Planctomycetota bacterium]